MRPTIQLGRWFGVPVGLHYSWFVVAWLITLSLANEYAAHATWTPTVVWSLAIATALLFFLCIVLHELAHAAVARLSGVAVHGITLFALGGIARIDADATSPAREFWIAIAGPAASGALAVVFFALTRVMQAVASDGVLLPFATMFDWLAYINLSLALFNLIPGFPLDGGRVLRSLLWALTGDGARATRIAARIGQLVALVFIGAGLYTLLTRNDFGGLWIAFIGWFLLEGAQAYELRVQPTTTTPRTLRR